MSGEPIDTVWRRARITAMSGELPGRDLSGDSSTPYITDDLPGIGGEIKVAPQQFVVKEIPLYEAAGDGEHVYVCLTREGWTTRALQQRLAELLGLRDVDVGYAGLKDKRALVTQVFSLYLPHADEQSVQRCIETRLPVQVEWVRRHRNKLKPGHLLGNHFQIVVADPVVDALARSHWIAESLRHHGVPNYYGLQRFGVLGDNARRGREALLGSGPRERWLRRFLLSAYQSALFNFWLSERIRRGWFGQVLSGDVAKKMQTGGMFEVTDAVVDSERLAQNEITTTGPIYGSKMWWASGEPGALERAVLDSSGVTVEMLGLAGLPGSRRPARLLLEHFSVSPHSSGLEFQFFLPKGAYATTLLREFTKTDSAVSDANE